ncbi:MAG: class I adenylate-forming enzyme family protein [Pseudomonadota bacterium]
MSQMRQDFDEAIAQLVANGAPFELENLPSGGRRYANAPKDLREALWSARQHGDREFLIYEGERYSFNQLLDHAEAIAGALQQRGVRQGERVAIAMRNYPEWMMAYLAVIAIGAVAVPVNSWGTASDVSFALQDCGAGWVFCDQQRYNGVSEAVAAGDLQACIARPDDPGHPASLQRLIDEGRGVVLAMPELSPDDLAMILYTSGTSGKPKGAASTHRAVAQAIFNMECAATAAAMTNIPLITAMMENGYEPTALLAVPLFHVSGLHAQFFANFRGGRRIVMMYKWDVDRALDYIERERVTTVSVAPAMALDLLEAPRFDQIDRSSLFALGVGGAATPPHIRAMIDRALPNNFSGTGWGMTETNAQGSSFTGRAFTEKSGSSGFPHPVVDLRVCDEAGAERPTGQAGELWVRSPTNICEYWNRPEANAAEFVDGWFRTGDIGYLDEDGFIHLSDRAKDVIIRGGENIYPAEIEAAVLEHPAVKEVAAVGMPHDRWGEEVAIAVHLHAEQNTSESDLMDHAAARLAPYKVPSLVHISREPLPRNATNKLLKHKIRESLQVSV